MTEATWFWRGYRDGQDRTPRKRAPDLPEDVLCLRREEAPREAAAYWDGWDAAIKDRVAALARANAAKAAT